MKRNGVIIGCLVSLIILALGTQPAVVEAVDLPCRTAKLIVPYKPGGGTDIIFRIVVNAANKAGAKPSLQVINIGGQSGMKGAKEVRRAKPDGCTLLAHHEALITNYVAQKSDFTWNAFEPVSNLTYTPYVLGARGDTPYNTLKELIAAAKKSPGKISVGVGLASTSHFLTLILEHRTGIRLKNVPYDGTKAKVSALLAKTIDLSALDVISAKKYIAQGSIKILASATAVRDPLLPEVPTFKEQGVDLVYGLNRGIYLPKGTPADIVEHWQGVFATASKDPSIVAELSKKGSSVRYLDAKGLRELMTGQTQVFLKIAKAVGLTQ
ncbi:MAG: tripartite tricarboxylate transporter substrate binding protein [Deltaproteobacteria bacterium]|nr:tripartite tricarboxylate transporter substrate binding protein [Deltaproteobacteria bacterium]